MAIPAGYPPGSIWMARDCRLWEIIDPHFKAATADSPALMTARRVEQTIPYRPLVPPQKNCAPPELTRFDTNGYFLAGTMRKRQHDNDLVKFVAQRTTLK